MWFLPSTPQALQENVMKKSPHETNRARQQALSFPSINGHVDLWASLTVRHQQECRQVICQMLVAITRQSRNVTHDDHEFLTQDSEQLTDD
jgi:hypothetical protein